MAERLPFALVDGFSLSADLRAVLRPGEALLDRDGRARRLPRFFYEVDSWQTAHEFSIAPNFRLSEFLLVDVREHELVRGFPKYVPCAVTLLGAHLQLFRELVGTYVSVAANGGYRSPSHALTRHASLHCWATAVNVFRVGDDLVDDQEKIEKYAQIAARSIPAMTSRPYGHTVGFADDHLHLDLGYTIAVPQDAASDTSPEQIESPLDDG